MLYFINFNTFLVDVDVEEDVIKERFIVEFVDFDVGTSNVILTVRNTGLTDITIDIISIVAIDAQTFIAHQTDTAKVIQPRTKDTINVTTTCVQNFVVDDACMSVNYRITLTTVRGNIYEIETIPLRA